MSQNTRGIIWGLILVWHRPRSHSYLPFHPQLLMQVLLRHQYEKMSRINKLCKMKRGKWSAHISPDHLRDLTQGSDPQTTMSAQPGWGRRNTSTALRIRPIGPQPSSTIFSASTRIATLEQPWSSFRWFVLTLPKKLQSPCHWLPEDLQANPLLKHIFLSASTAGWHRDKNKWKLFALVLF